jgi:predicted nucleic acid-binding protein
MYKVIIDTSAWIEYFRGNKKYMFIDTLLDQNRVYINDVILSELLPSILQKKETELAELLQDIFCLTLNIDWNEIRTYQLMNLKKGNNKTGLLDIVIVQNCIQNSASIVAEDKHFGLMSGYLPINLL